MMMDRLLDAVIAAQNPSVLGLDTRIEYFPERFAGAYDLTTLDGAAEAITDFNQILIDAVCDIIPAVKVQAAYYEMYGVAGMGAFFDTLDYAKRKGMTVIADVKRNDIGSTAAAYSAAYLGNTALRDNEDRAFRADFVTVNPYLGTDGIEPFVGDCALYDKGIFVLVKTSNPSGRELQDLDVGGCALYERVGDLVAGWGAGLIGRTGYSSVGGRRRRPPQASSHRMLFIARLRRPGGDGGGAGGVLRRKGPGSGCQRVTFAPVRLERCVGRKRLRESFAQGGDRHETRHHRGA